MDWAGLDWTGLDGWTGLDWTVGLDWTGLILIYIFKCNLHLKVFILGNFTCKYLPVISYGWPFVSKWVRDIWALIQCIFLDQELVPKRACAKTWTGLWTMDYGLWTMDYGLWTVSWVSRGDIDINS